jgi:Domain of unknown function (DUF6458)
MGIGTALAFIALGAILAFAFNFDLSGIDIHTIGWILILVGVAMLLITLMYTRPRRARRRVVNVVEGQPGRYVSEVEDPPIVTQEPHVVTEHVEPEAPTEIREVRGHRRDIPPSGSVR